MYQAVVAPSFFDIKDSHCEPYYHKPKNMSAEKSKKKYSYSRENMEKIGSFSTVCSKLAGSPVSPRTYVPSPMTLLMPGSDNYGIKAKMSKLKEQVKTVFENQKDVEKLVNDLCPKLNTRLSDLEQESFFCKRRYNVSGFL
jgi:hypothetical protein